jgi:hypothetical protein
MDMDDDIKTLKKPFKEITNDLKGSLKTPVPTATDKKEDVSAVSGSFSTPEPQPNAVPPIKAEEHYPADAASDPKSDLDRDKN